MIKLLARIVINAIAIWLTAYFLEGLNFEGSIWELMIVAIIFGLINAVIKPILKLLTLPITILTLGLFTLVINALMLILTVGISGSLSFGDVGFFQSLLVALIASIIISIISTVLNWFVD